MGTLYYHVSPDMFGLLHNHTRAYAALSVIIYSDQILDLHIKQIQK